MSTFDARLYNKLPTIESAARTFSKSERETLLPKLTELFDKAEYKRFGICLVHRHCELEHGERMIARGLISQPERVNDSDCYAERWLATGQAYEFNERWSEAPPESLFNDFRDIIADKHAKTLGIFYVHDLEASGVALERTEGRMNISEIMQYQSPRRSVPTAWRSDRAQTARLYECASCRLFNNSHVENVEKMDGLERRRDLGHEINALQAAKGDTSVSIQ